MGSADTTLLLSIWSAILIWTCSVTGSVIWLTGKFRHVENLIYKELERHREHNDAQFNNLGTRVQRLELHAFGFTGSGRAMERDRAHDPAGE